ncbi:MAG: M23 family metallopeptidase [Telluria sp.]
MNVNCWRNAPDNEVAGIKDPDDVSNLIGVGGNAVVIKTAAGVFVKHSHMIPGSVPSAICPQNKIRFDKPSGSTLPPEAAVTDGVMVTKGQFLGLAGNSGNSDLPHLHVHMFKDNVPFPMHFERGMTTPYTDNTAAATGPWTALKGNTLPTGPILIWAPRSVSNWTVNNISSAMLQPWSSHMIDSGQMPESLACSSGGAVYNTQWVPSKGTWYARAGLNATEFANLTNALAGQGYYQYKWWYCDSVRSAIWRK